MSRKRIALVTLGIMLSLFMASMESTVVATAMPTIVSQLGGLAIYSWVFSAYMLASTTMMPIYGKLSDLYGRRLMYIIAMVLFLGGSMLSGQARSMEQLIFFRALQGLGAGGVQPLAFIIVGDLFNLEQRARVQGLFSGVWGVSSIVGPLIGGFLVDQVSWRWVFYVNVLPGLLAAAIVWFAWKDRHLEGKGRVNVDYRGAALLTLGIVLLLLGLFELGTSLGWALIATALALFGGLIWVERRAADPLLPLALFRERLFTVATLHGVLAGWAMFGSLSFVPLFVQAVLGTSATSAGATLSPMLLGWVTASIIGSRLLLRISYRTLALLGMSLLTSGALLMSQAGAGASQSSLMAYLAMMGVGMGLSVPPFLIAVQSTVRKNILGTATSTIQFSRSMGGTLGVSVMGAFLSARLAAGLRAAGQDPAAVSLDSLLDPVASASLALEGSLRNILAGAISSVFVIAFIAAGCGLLVTLLAPRGRIAQLAAGRDIGEVGKEAAEPGAAKMGGLRGPSRPAQANGKPFPVGAVRWQTGFSLEAYVSAMCTHQAEMRRRLGEVQLAEADLSDFAQLRQPIHALVMSEDWCGDALMNLPILARLAQAAPQINVRVFVRSQEPDLDGYYRERGITHIPVFTFLDAGFNEIGTWVERPKAARERLAEWLAAHPEIEAIRRDPGLEEEVRRDRLREIGTRLVPEMEGWYAGGLQQATVDEVKEILQPVLILSELDHQEKTFTAVE
ncbi:MAG TPA: MFS transporter [Anaerolineales bacterium]|nr:MFS transporter [Anaerolineales bacterium]